MTFNNVDDDVRWTSFAYAFGIIVLAVVAYYPAVLAGFVWDDDNYVTANLTLRTLDGLKDIWLTPGAVPQYYPLVHTSFWVEYQLWGLNPVGYHIVNVLLHIVSALLVRLILQRLAVPGAWLAAAIFALHPVHVESVAWVTERKNVLSAVFYLSSLLAYLKFSDVSKPDPNSESTARTYFVAFILYLCALLSKTIVCSLPATIIIILWWRCPRLSWKQLTPLIPFFVFGLGFGLFTIHMEKHNVGAAGPQWDISYTERVLIAGRALWFYPGKLLWPVSLIFSYPRWEIQVSDWRSWIYPVSYLFALVSLYAARLRIGKGPIVTVLIYTVTVFPALGFFDIYPMRYSFVADHFQYLASIPIIALFSATIALARNNPALTVLPRIQASTRSAPGRLGAIIYRKASSFRNIVRYLGRGNLKSSLRMDGVRSCGPHERTPSIRTQNCIACSIVSVAILLSLGISTWIRCHAFEDAETLWKDTISRNPKSWMAHNNLGLIYEGRQRFDEAIYHYRNTIKLKSDHAAARNNLAMVWEKKGEFTYAFDNFKSALLLEPGNLWVINNFANFLSRQKRYDQALVLYERALEINGDSIPTLVNLGILRAQQHDFDGAVTLFSRVLKLDPNNSSARHNLNLALENRNNQRD